MGQLIDEYERSKKRKKPPKVKKPGITSIPSCGVGLSKKDPTIIIFDIIFFGTWIFCFVMITLAFWGLI